MLLGFIRFLASRGRFATSGSFLYSGYSRILRRFSRMKLLRGNTRKVFLKDIKHHFLARLGTSDFLVLEEIYFRNEYEEVARFIKEPVNLIVDLGSNAGYSLRYWHQHFPNARFIAVEPDKNNAALCIANVESAGFSSQLKLHMACVGSHSREVKLSENVEAWEIRLEECSAFEVADTTVLTMPQLMGGLPETQQIDLLKCDIEGSEAELFSNCGEWIKLVCYMIVELHPPYGLPDFMKAIQDTGIEFEVLSIKKQDSCPVIFLKRI